MPRLLTRHRARKEFRDEIPFQHAQSRKTEGAHCMGIATRADSLYREQPYRLRQDQEMRSAAHDRPI